MTTTLTTDSSTEEEAPVLLAVSYLRVSTREQAERGGTEEGFSIPAQRDAISARLTTSGRGSCGSSWTRASLRVRRIVMGCRTCSRSSKPRGCSSASCTSSTASPGTGPMT